jgi:hypothetical protein
MGNPLALSLGPGTIRLGLLGTAEPVDLSAAWASGWLSPGYTESGSTISAETSYEDVLVAEELDPVLVLPTARTVMFSAALAEITATNMKRIFNGGTITAGSGCVYYEPPNLGTEVALMIGWESDDLQERWIFRKATQTGAVEMSRNKAPNKALLPGAWRCVKPSAGVTAFRAIMASPARA